MISTARRSLRLARVVVDLFVGAHPELRHARPKMALLLHWQLLIHYVYILHICCIVPCRPFVQINVFSSRYFTSAFSLWRTEIATITGNNYDRLWIKIAARYYALHNGRNKARIFFNFAEYNVVSGEHCTCITTALMSCAINRPAFCGRCNL